jgi:hypothetical protein
MLMAAPAVPIGRTIICSLMSGMFTGRCGQGKFTITHVFVYSAGKGYQELLPAKVSISKIPR